MNYYAVGFNATPYGSKQEDPLFASQVGDEREFIKNILVGKVTSKTLNDSDLSGLAQLRDKIFLTDGLKMQEEGQWSQFSNKWR